MDTGEGYFKQFKSMDDLIKEHPEKFDLKDSYGPNEDIMKYLVNDSGIFKVGEIIELRGSKFKIKNIKPTELRLKLLKK